MWELLVVEPDIAVQRGFQFLAGSEVVALKHLLDAAVEALDPLPGRRLPAIAERDPVGLRRLGRGQSVLDAEVGAERVEFMLTRRGTLAQAEQAIGELLAVICENGADADRAGALKVAQEPPGVGRGLGLEDADEDPSGRPPLGDALHHLPGNGSIATNR